MKIKSTRSYVIHLSTTIVLMALCLTSTTSKAQYIPLDTAFATYLSHNGYSHCISGSSLDTTCADTSLLYYMVINGTHTLHDINGIKYFKHLTYLTVTNMTLDSLPALPPNLYQLTFSDLADSNNHKLAPLPASLRVLDIMGVHSGADTANYLDSLPAMPNALLSLYFSGVRIGHFPKHLPDSLLTLFESASKIDTLASLPNHLQYLYLDLKNISQIPVLSDSLKWLYLISMAHLTSLPGFPSHLLSADIYDDTMLTALPTLPNSLQYLFCYNEHISTLPLTLPPGLIYLYMYQTNLGSLPTLPSTLRYLVVPYNHIGALPSLPDSLKYLYSANNPIKNLPIHLPDSLLYIWCSYDSLTHMPAIPSNLVGLWCDHNAIDTVPPMPNTVKYFDCQADNLTFLPALSDSLYYFYCDYNNISTMPALPSKLIYMGCSMNPKLSGLPDLPKCLFWLNADYDSSIACLPVLNPGMYIYFYATKVACVPNYAPYYSYPSIGTYPLCALGSSCETGWNITGHVYKDSISSCVYDTIDPVYSYVRVLLYAHDTLSQVTYTTANGGYTFRTKTIDTFYTTIDTNHLAYKVKCPATDTIIKVITATDSVKQNADFALECKNGYDGAIWNIYTWNWYFQPGHVNEVAVYSGDISKLYGLHCLSGIGGKLVVHIHGPVTYDSFPSYSLTPTSANSDSIVWTITDFGSVNPLTAFHFYLKTDTNSIWYDTVGISAAIKINTRDADSTNNYLRNRFWVYTSWDPNSKEVYPTSPTTPNEWITYTIHFQNAGKATADNIHIMDTLDKNLDWSTFQVVASDHPVHSHLSTNGVVEFYFNMIELPDSAADVKHSTGYVKYRLKMKSNTPYGTAIKNKAYVYFDYNPGVVTNTAISKLTHAGASTAISAIHSAKEIQLYPNPAKDIVTIKLNGTSYLVGLQLEDITGRQLASITYKTMNASYKLNMNSYPAGVYFIKVVDNNGNSMIKKIVLSK